MNKCNCGDPLDLHPSWNHAFDCPARFNFTNRKLVFIGEDRPETEVNDVELTLQTENDTRRDPYNYFGPLMQPDQFLK